MHRRALLRSIPAIGLAAPGLARAQGSQVLRFVPQADIAVLDPHSTTGLVTRNHAYLVFDTLYGVDASFKVQPQMVEGHTVEDDGKRWTMTLREGLKFHDGEPVRGRDVIASLVRWKERNTFANAMFAIVEELTSPSDRIIVWRLKRPFPMLPEVLGNSSSPVAAIMPERLAKTDIATLLTDMVGSGPFRFVADERIPGSRTVYAKFDGYVPRAGTPSLLSGGKIVNIDRVEWLNLPDASTAAAALQRGEIDWWEQPPSDLLPVVTRTRGLKVAVLDKLGAIACLRPNHTLPPFNNAAMRRALLPAISQTDTMTAVAGTDKQLWRDGVGYFAPGSPMASDVGMEALTAPRDLAAARKALEAAGYNGEKVLLMAPTDFASITAMSEVTADVLRRIGVDLEYAAMDWGSMLVRMANREPPDRGGYNLFCTYSLGVTHMNPATHNFLRGSGDKATFGWPDIPRMEELRDEWLFSSDPDANQRIGREMQKLAFENVPYIPLGQFYQPTAYRDRISNLLEGAPLFWNLKLA